MIELYYYSDNDIADCYSRKQDILRYKSNTEWKIVLKDLSNIQTPAEISFIVKASAQEISTIRCACYYGVLRLYHFTKLSNMITLKERARHYLEHCLDYETVYNDFEWYFNLDYDNDIFFNTPDFYAHTEYFYEEAVKRIAFYFNELYEKVVESQRVT